MAGAPGVGSHSNRGWVDGDGALSSQALRSTSPLKEGKRQSLPDLVGNCVSEGQLQASLCPCQEGQRVGVLSSLISTHTHKTCVPDHTCEHRDTCFPGPHLGLNTFKSRPTLRLSYLCTHTHFDAHTHLCALTRGTHAHSAHSLTNTP